MTGGGEKGIEIADRHAVPGEERRPLRKETGELRKDAPLGRVDLCADLVGDRRPAQSPKRLPGLQPLAGVRTSASGQNRMGKRVTGETWIGVNDVRRQKHGVAPSAVLVDQNLATGREALQVLQQWLRGWRRAETDDDVRSQFPADRLIAEEGVVAVHHRHQVVPTATDLRKRVSEDGISDCGGEPGNGFGEGGIILRAANDDPARCGSQFGGKRCDEIRGRRSRIASCRHVRDVAGSALTGDGIQHSYVLTGLRQGQERFAEREVEMHRTGWFGDGNRDGAAGDGTGMAEQIVGYLGHRHIDEPLDVAAVEVDLIDCLGGAEGAHLRRAISREDNERDARMMGLDNGRQKIRGRGP